MKLIFVYNAESGITNSLLNVGHKILNLNTYKCILCSLTFGVFKEKEEWQQFLESSKIKTEFLHMDEFEKKIKKKENIQLYMDRIIQVN